MNPDNQIKETPLLKIKDLTISLHQGDTVYPVIESFNLEVNRKQIIGLVGESGSGKSVLCMTAMKLLDDKWSTKGQININGHDIQSLSNTEMTKIRGNDAAMIFQDASASLNPVSKIGKQLSETIKRLRGVNAKEAKAIAIDLLGHVGIPEPDRRYNEYPFQLSGGQNQRVMIALALAGKPKVLFADEPTTALDVTVQAQILELIQRLTDESEMGVVFVSHDLGVVANLCTDIVVMYAGRIVEQGPTQTILENPKHPYTQGLINSMPSKHGGQPFYIKGKVPSIMKRPKGCAFAPRCAVKTQACEKDIPELKRDQKETNAIACFHPTEFIKHKTEQQGESELDINQPAPPLLELKSASCDYEVLVKEEFFSKKSMFRAVDSIDIQIHEGNSMALIGESGSGKTSISKLILGIEAPSTGEVLLNGKPVPRIGTPEYKKFSKTVQLIPQNPSQALDPRITIGKQIAEPIIIHQLAKLDKVQTRVHQLMDSVGLTRELFNSYPHELSGGQLQRAVIARALSLKPKILICDEPTSALDVSVQGQIVELLNNLRQKYNLTILFITHDLRVIRSLCDDVAVMFAGKIIEKSPTSELFTRQHHPYSKDLLAAAPDLDSRISTSVTNFKSSFPSTGCKYFDRCKGSTSLCSKIDPPLIKTDSKGSYTLCHYVGTL